MRPRLLSLLLAALAPLAALGCGSREPSAATGPPARSVEVPDLVTVYFARPDASALVGERRPVPAGVTPLRAAMDALADGPRLRDARSGLPPGTRVISASASGGTALVDLSADYADGFPPGSAGEIATVAPVVYTATGVPGVRRVRLTVEGSPPAIPGAQLDLASPLTRADVRLPLEGPAP